MNPQYTNFNVKVEGPSFPTGRASQIKDVGIKKAIGMGGNVTPTPNWESTKSVGSC